MNENGEQFADFCGLNGLVHGNTILPHREIHRTAWVSKTKGPKIKQITLQLTTVGKPLSQPLGYLGVQLLEVERPYASGWQSAFEPMTSMDEPFAFYSAVEHILVSKKLETTMRKKLD